ncbi:hypothetical protein GN244_ATG20147 [Phytophthora infestans]|uniref:Uncharacterized protein n=1 Tax=Phytophthora infestans TaxID=4787 RepID=A0A833SFT2_PHYIN|nr:hypothetical protein GN244_ATG20147 [Phytophthora infestans]
MDDGDAPRAAQISQADIIERQAESIARLKKQVQKGSEYKEQTKSKLKEAAARLKEYRLRVETLLRSEETLKEQLQTEQAAHAKTKKQHKTTLNQVKTRKQTHAATQTDEKKKITRTSQTLLSGDVERVNKKTMVDSEVQTVHIAIDTLTSKNEAERPLRRKWTKSCRNSRHLLKETLEDTLAISKEPLELLDGHMTTFPHQTSAALDAELAFSDSDAESGETLKLDSMAETGASVELIPFDASISNEIDKELDFSDDEMAETTKSGDLSTVKAHDGAEMSLLSGIDATLQSEIDKELESSSDDESVETRKNAEIADEIDKALESSDEEKEKEKTNVTAVDTGDSHGCTLMSIDDELDDEFAALEADSEPENSKPAKDNLNPAESSSSSSSDSDSSDSSDSESGEDGDDPMTGIADKTPDREACTTDSGALTRPVTAMYSPVVEAKSSCSTPEPLQLSATNHKEDTSAASLQPKPVQKSISDDLQPTTTVDDTVVVQGANSSSTNDDNSSIPVSKPAALIEQDKPVPDTIMQPPERATERGELVRNVQVSEPPSVPKDTSPKRSRKADEAALSAAQSSAQKKAKREEISTQAKIKKPAKESKDERRMKKSLALFTQAIVLNKNEQADSKYARRTITVLVSQSSRFLDTLAHVMTLCQILADSFRALQIPPIDVVRGALGVFRTPRSRRLLQESKLGLSGLVHEVLLRLLRQGDTLKLSNVDDCLLHLRGFLVENRAHFGGFLSSNMTQVHGTAQHVNVSHDKVFLAHICALHTHLCRSTRQLTRARVLLFDIIRDNPDIRGLYFAVVILEIYPDMFEREFDDQCVERRDVLKETLQHAFIVISSTAAEKQQLLLHQSSFTMLHRIADAIHKPELEQVDGTDLSVQKLYVQKLYDQLAVQNTDYFALAKCVEICTTVSEVDLVTDIFSVEKCRELFSAANTEAKTGILSAVGHIAMTIVSEQYVESFIDWLYELVSFPTSDKVSEDHVQLLVTSSKVCIDLILAYSAAAGLKSRRRVLCAIVKWFDATPADQLLHLPAAFLRRLRIAVVSARPQIVPV